VADALEIPILLAPGPKVRSLGDASRARSLRWARMCYDHLAGAVGVSVTQALIGRGLVGERDGGFVLVPEGAALTRSMLERRWITTREASRIVTVTEAGKAGLRDWPGVDLAVLRRSA
jgi:hypothetical protein